MTAAEQASPMTDIKAMKRELCNWNTWGPHDELGTLNYVTPDKLREAAASVRSGETISLAIDLDDYGPQGAVGRRFNPKHFMTATHLQQREGGTSIADDVLMLPLQCATQWDALAHVADQGVMYGGRPSTEVLESGANVNSIKAISDRVATRAVLVDIARMAGVEALEPGTPIGVEDIQRCLSGTNTQVRRGDILLVRTGFLQHCRQRQWKGYLGPAPGLTAATLPWIHEIGLAGVASDTSAVEVVPFSVPGVHAPFHVVGIVYMGLLVGEMFDLDQLAARCHDDGRYDFMLVAAPLPVSRAVGSPINPYGIR